VGSVPTKLPSMRLATESPDIAMPAAAKRLMTSPLITLLAEVSICNPLEVPALVPLSSIFKTASSPTALVLGEAPGWV
jgi:hypothetical protein